MYERLEYDTPTGDLKRDFWGVSGTVPIGPGELYAFYGDASDGKGGAARAARASVRLVTVGCGTGAKQWEV